MCEITIQVNCPYCHSMKVVKNGVKRTGRQNFLCRACGKQFQYVYQKAGCRPEAKQLVLRMLVRNSGIRDIEKVTGVHRQTVLRWLNQKADSLQVIPRHRHYVQVQIDEVWTFQAAQTVQALAFLRLRAGNRRSVGLELGKPQPAHSRKAVQAVAGAGNRQVLH